MRLLYLPFSLPLLSCIWRLLLLPIFQFWIWACRIDKLKFNVFLKNCRDFKEKNYEINIAQEQNLGYSPNNNQMNNSMMGIGNIPQNMIYYNYNPNQQYQYQAMPNPNQAMPNPNQAPNPVNQFPQSSIAPN